MPSNDIVWIASFDIGKKNFSFYVEEVDKTQLLSLPSGQKYNSDGTPTPALADILRSVWIKGKKVLLANLDLTYNSDSSIYLDPQVLYNLIETMDEYSEYWDQCDVFVIEKQMSFGKRHNTMALKLGQHCWSYFAIRYGKSKEIIEFPAYHKTQVLGAQKERSTTKTGKVRYKAVNKPARKKWCVQKALEILRDRDDYETSEQIQGTRKKDDLSDVICQLQAFKYLRYVQNSQSEKTTSIESLG